MNINNYYWIGIVTWKLIIVYKLLELYKNTWIYITMQIICIKYEYVVPYITVQTNDYYHYWMGIITWKHLMVYELLVLGIYY